MLTSPRWYPPNLEHINRWLQTLKTPRSFAACAVFDFDHTTIFGDIADQTFVYQIQTRSLRMTPQILDELLGQPLHAQHAELKRIALDAYPNHHQRFCVATALYVHAIGNHDRPRWLQTMSGFLHGFTESEAQALGYQACMRAHKAPMACFTWTCDLPQLTYTHDGAIRSQNEVHDLYTAIDQAGIPVRIVSASAEYIVRGAAHFLKLPVDDQGVFGMRLQKQNNNTLTYHRDTSRPLTYREGKALLIQTCFQERPIFVAGDSDNDVAMLTHFEETEVRLIFHRHFEDNAIGELYQEALTQQHQRSGLTLLQGRDETTGNFRPYPHSLMHWCRVSTFSFSV